MRLRHVSQKNMTHMGSTMVEAQGQMGPRHICWKTQPMLREIRHGRDARQHVPEACKLEKSDPLQRNLLW